MKNPHILYLVSIRPCQIANAIATQLHRPKLTEYANDQNSFSIFLIVFCGLSWTSNKFVDFFVISTNYVDKFDNCSLKIFTI